MLTVAALRSADASYYFYAPELSLPGDRWIGQGCEAAGVVGGPAPPTREAVEEILSGSAKQWERALPGARPDRRRNLGYDAVFSTPKSVSLAAALGSEPVVQAIRRSHDASVAAAFAYLEEQASPVVRGNGRNRVYLRSSGFAGAAFAHATSRSLDPHLHTHVVFANFGLGEDGKWSAFNSSHLWASARTAGFLYEAHLRHRLTSVLGVGWQPVARGTAEMAGFSPEVLDEFSTRSRQVRSRLRADGRDPATVSHREDQWAGLATRPDKPAHTDMARLAEQWCHRGARLGLTQASIDDLLGRHRADDPDARAAWLVGARLARSPALARSDRTLRREALRAACEAIPPGADPRSIPDIATAALGSTLVRDSRARATGCHLDADMSISR